MATQAWIEADYESAWSAFQDKVGFRPGIYPDTWPAIREPTPSITLDLSPIAGASEARFKAGVAAVNSLSLYAFTHVTAPDERLLFLDWQHSTYRFSPNHVTASYSASDPPVFPHGDYPPVFPDGDYYIFLTEDLSCGTFGHPWEQTLCVFGEPLVDLLGRSLGAWLPTCRENGAPVDST